MGLALELARRSNALRWESFPSEAVRWAKVAITDTVGCTLAGVTEGTARIARRVAADGRSSGPCTVLGTRQRLRRLDAAFVNATTGHALDFDDTSKSMAGHPTVIILPAVLALAEALDLSGRAALEAYIVGLETATRIARGVNFHHYEKGWHPTATLGIFGAAAGCSRLLGADDAKLATALATAVSLASGVKSNFGTQVKPLHAGAASRNGLVAAMLAHEGFDAAEAAFEHPQGFLEVFNGAGHYDAARMLEGWGAPLDLLNPGISIKKYPCVYSVHAAVDAAIVLAGTHSFAAPDIERVLVRMHRRRLLPHVQRMAESALDAKFSLPYAIARGLIDGKVSLEHFERSAWTDPAIRAVMARVETQPHDDDANDYGAEVSVTLASGETVTHGIPIPLGHGPRAPLPEKMLRAKFEDCATRTLTAERAREVFDLLQSLESLPRIRTLTERTAAVTKASTKAPS